MSFTVRFLNYAGDDLLGVVTAEKGEDITGKAPTPETIDGKAFVSWNAPITNIQEDMTVRPLYATLYQVAFYGFDGETILKTEAVAEGGSATAPMPEVVAHYTFEKWSCDFSNVKANLSVYSIYKAETFTVRFLNKDATDVWSVQQVPYHGNAVPPAPEKYKGFIFLGWNTSFTDIEGDKTIKPVYRQIPVHPVLNFYRKLTDESSGELFKSYNMVNSCNITQKLSGECSINVKLLTRQTEGVISMSDRLEVDGLVFYITELKKSISSGICYTEMSGDHISYILNNKEFKVAAYDKEGTPMDILQELLTDTPFNVGKVDFTEKVTLRVNKEATRRACLMQLIALVGGEIEYYGYTIGIRKHVGESIPIDIVKRASVQDINCTYNVSDNTTNYNISLYQKGGLEMGDELLIKFKQLGLDTKSRIVGMDWNPFNYKEVSITVGQYIPTLNDSLYQLEKVVADIRESTAKYTVEFGEMVGNGSFYFTRAYQDRPYFQVDTDDGSKATVTLNRKSGSAFGAYVGATLTGVSSTTVSLLVFYCTVPDVSEEESS